MPDSQSEDSLPRIAPMVAIDGPAGAGKSTASRELARRLGFFLLDTGALYRGLALAAQQEGIPWDDEIRERDQRDATRAVAPLRQAEDALYVDTSDLTLEQVIDRLESEARARLDIPRR